MVDSAEKIAADKRLVIPLVDQKEVLEIACDLVDIASPTGHEKACADYIMGRYKSAGIKILPQEFDEDRANAIGIIKGKGNGPCLMLNGHMDTSYVGNEENLPDAPGYKPKAYIDGDWLYGLGIYNMKGSLACFLHAAELLKRAGIELEGDLMIACVGGEIERSQVDRFQGALYRGGGCGTWYAITHGAVADFAVVGEPSAMTLGRAHGGYVWTKITLIGDPMHTIYGQNRNNTIHNMMKIMHAVEAWGEDYEKRSGKYGMRANSTLSAIEGGWPYRCSRVPVACTLYVDTRLMPGQSPLKVQREIEDLVENLRKNDPDLAALSVDTTIFMNQWGSECSPEEYIWDAMAAAHEEVTGNPVEITARPAASDACELVAHGIPSLNYGAPGRTREASGLEYYGRTDWNPRQGEHMHIEDLVTGGSQPRAARPGRRRRRVNTLFRAALRVGSRLAPADGDEQQRGDAWT
jgi:acetylornithine deacetylase